MNRKNDIKQALYSNDINLAKDVTTVEQFHKKHEDLVNNFGAHNDEHNYS